MKKTILLIFLTIFFNTTMVVADDADEDKLEQESWITILVHGIISVKPHLSISNVIRFMRDKVADTSYERSIQEIRKDPFFYQNHPMQGLGLLAIDQNNTQPGAAASAYAQIFDLIESFVGNSCKNCYYTFGWSGLLSPRMRYLEAKIFYDHLLKEFGRFGNLEKRPKLRIIGYSHGGNIALRLAEVYNNESYDQTEKIEIDELILVGAPVLPETDYLTHCPLFKKIYHFYSYGDRVQRLDFFSFDRIFSNRKFHDRTDFSLPEKLVQINIKVKRPAYTARKSCTANYDHLLHHRASIRNSDPGHTELWSFGWSPSSYRENFPLNPLPFTVFTPYLIRYLQESMPNAKNVMVELHPFYERMLFYDYEKKEEKITSFLSFDQFNQLRKHAEIFRPPHFTKEKYNKKINTAIYDARKERFDQWKKQQALRKNKKIHGPIAQDPIA